MTDSQPIRPSVTVLAPNKYRRDIDGLRALAVLPIILFHVGVAAVPGGYIGVDVFFVISGFLIGGIVLNELEQARFSFAKFWLRRVRRILPALSLTLLMTTSACCLLLLPVDLVKYSQSLIAAALSSANIYYWLTTNYFDNTAIDRPLLHLWSLGVEEQFYLLFPIIIWAIHRWARRSMLVLTLTGALLSFLLSNYLIPRASDAAFYLLPPRAWELLLGFLVTMVPSSWMSARAIRELTAGLGLMAIFAGIFLFSPDTPFPGTAALLPCCGAAAIILAGAGGSSIVSAILETRVLVWTGLLSFSLYLWHWPLIVLAHYAIPAVTLSPFQQTGVVGLTYLIAYASWRWIERPFRETRAAPTVAFAWGAASIVVICGIGGMLIVAKGLPGRYDPHVARMAGFLDYNPNEPFRDSRCFLRPGQNAQTLVAAGCVTAAETRPNVLLLGNSHAAHLWAGLARVAPEVNLMQATASGWTCVPLLHTRESPVCDSLWQYVFGQIVAKRHLDLIIISATWEQFELAALDRTLAALRSHGIPVLLIAPGPQYEIALPRLLAFAAMRNDPRLPAMYETASPRRFDKRLRELVLKNGATYLSAYTALCARQCQTMVDADPLLFDTDHLTVHGSVLLANAIVSTPAWRALKKH